MIFCSMDSGSIFSSPIDTIVLLADTARTIKGLKPETRYFFGVAVMDSLRQSARSNIVDTTTDTICPPQASIIHIVGVNDSSVDLAWSESRSEDFLSYQLFCSTDSSGLFIKPTRTILVRNDTIYRVTGLNAATTYIFCVTTNFKSSPPARSNLLTVSTITANIAKPPIIFQFESMPDTLHPVISMLGSIGSLCITKDSKIAGSVALSSGKICDEQGNRIIDTNVRQIIIGYDQNRFPLPFLRERVDSLFKRISGLKTGNHAATTLTPWDSVINFSGDSTIMQEGNYNRRLVIARGSLIIPSGASINGCVILSDKSIIVSGSTETSLLEADSGIVLSAGLHGSQFFSYGLITIRSSAMFKNSNTIISHGCFNAGNNNVGCGITIDSQSTIKGTIISYSECYPVAANGDYSVRVGEKSRIEGTIITDGFLMMKNCVVIGHLWFHSLHNTNIKNGSTVGYINYTWGMTIIEPQPEYEFPITGSPFVEGIDLLK
jgi:hypothetical protein